MFECLLQILAITKWPRQLWGRPCRGPAMTDGALSVSCLRVLHQMALRHAFTSDEADDLVQDVLLAAIEQERDFDGAPFLRWASGVLRRRAMFLARTAGRRKRREAVYAHGVVSAPEPRKKLPRQFIDSLPPALQTVALLANAGLGRREIVGLLRISDTALRQRISALRRAWKRSGVAADVVEILQSNSPPRGVPPRSIEATLVKLPRGRLAVADPDGHSIYLSSAREPAAGGKATEESVIEGSRHR